MPHGSLSSHISALSSQNSQLALHLQAGADQGPMACYEPISMAALVKAQRSKKGQTPIPRDDVGVVVRDQGPGTWRGVLVRHYLGRHSKWSVCKYFKRASVVFLVLSMNLNAAPPLVPPLVARFANTVPRRAFGTMSLYCSLHSPLTWKSWCRGRVRGFSCLATCRGYLL